MALNVPEGMDVAQALWELEAIKQLKARYFRLVDTQQWSELEELFAPDFVYRPSASPDRPVALDEFFALMRSHLVPGVSVHQGFMPEIELLSATAATGVWAMHDYVERRPPGGPPVAFHGYGHYLDRYERAPGGPWCIKESRMTRLRIDGP